MVWSTVFFLLNSKNGIHKTILGRYFSISFRNFLVFTPTYFFAVSSIRKSVARIKFGLVKSHLFLNDSESRLFLPLTPAGGRCGLGERRKRACPKGSYEPILMLHESHATFNWFTEYSSPKECLSFFSLSLGISLFHATHVKLICNLYVLPCCNDNSSYNLIIIMTPHSSSSLGRQLRHHTLCLVFILNLLLPLFLPLFS